MFKKYYSHFLNANKGVQHYAAHSHHYWPDVTREAQIQYWDDSAKYVDDKWDYLFSKKIPQVQELIADVLNLSHPAQLAFAPNTHEFIYRLLSCFEPQKQIRVLTTDSEFHSFDRQINRLAENKNEIVIDKIPTLPFSDFEERFINKIKTQSYDLIFLSHVFFNSGFVVPDLQKIVTSVSSPSTMIVVDGYHGFMSVPTNLESIEDRVFYLAGSYKYAQGGEGCCFLHVPKNCDLRPKYTGWFAGFSELSLKSQQVNYASGGFRFAGSTMDFSALYRLHAALTLFKNEGLSVNIIHKHIQKLQNNFLEHLDIIKSPLVSKNNLLLHDLNHHGHFLAFEMKSASETKDLHDFLYKNNIRTDYRSTRLRFGFALYQNDCIDLSVLNLKK